MTLISDEAVEAAIRGMLTANGDNPDTMDREGMMWRYYDKRARAALTAALPHIAEGLAREFEKQAMLLALDSSREARFAAASHLRSLAPMGEK